ncbi:hypothetical protein AB0E63_45625 [Kribbella sp. NPDC026596]|uniref:hypothetical protein n=1 Tax=Kribbella sp. NPDC026596 TaxID=3155122 RepID=UPI0033F0B785
MILALGVALVLTPPDTYGGTPLTTADKSLRWCAAGLAIVLGLGELVWWWQSSRLRRWPHA